MRYGEILLNSCITTTKGSVNTELSKGIEKLFADTTVKVKDLTILLTKLLFTD